MKLNSKMRYQFDTFIGKGGVSIFISLLISFLAILLVLAALRGVLLMAFPAEEIQWDLNFWGNAYITFLELTDPGNMAQDIESSPWFKIIAIMAGMFGLIIFSSLIAVITTALDQKMEALKRGHSKVIEKEHTIILGWDEQRIVEIVNELVIANESERNACVVILADEDKVEMDEIIKLRLPNTQTTRVVTRSGNTSSIANLNTVSIDKCESVIIISGGSESASARENEVCDAKVIQTILAVNGSLPEDNHVPIIAEIYNRVHRDIIAKSFPAVVTVDTSDILAKLLVQTSRSVGLSVVYSEILSYDGCEMYFYNDKNWAGLKWKDLAFHFPDGVPMGIRTADDQLLLNPDGEVKIGADDEILIVADDDSTIEYKSKTVADPSDLKLVRGESEQKIEKELIIGWNNKIATILSEYADYVMNGSQIDILLEEPTEEVRNELEEAKKELDKININLVDVNPLSLTDLQSLEPFKYDNIIILAEQKEDLAVDGSDSKNLVTLLLFREIFNQAKNPVDTKLITEIVDSQNHSLISQTGVKDVIISNKLVSMILAQVSQNRKIKEVYDNLFSEDGSEIYLKEAKLYSDTFPMEISFASMMSLAQQRGEVCIGVKIKSKEDDSENNYGVKLIPEKNEKFKLNKDDCFVVLSEDEF